MKFNKIIMNPPYDKALHLKVLEAILNRYKDTEIINLSPSAWLENPLTPYKMSVYKKYLESIGNKLSNLKIIKASEAQKLFNIGIDTDLGIYYFNNNLNNFNFNSIRYNIVNSIFSKIISKLSVISTIGKVADIKKVDGWRCRINELRQNSGGSNPTTKGYSAKTWAIQLISSTEKGIADCVFFNGYNKNNVYWTETKSKNQWSKNIGAGFPYSIRFDTELEALNFAVSCNTNFYRNWIYMIKFDQHMPLNFLPFMSSYKKVWSNEDYCKFFELDKEESKFMCRTISDFRYKDFINYEEFNSDI